MKGLAVTAAVASLSLGAASAQTIGDIGQDAQGNVYTFGYDATGNRVWLPGRQGGPAQSQRTITAERYIPTIWTDPDGCEHWVMDDGIEGFMTPHVTRDGIPVCSRQACAVMQADSLFEKNGPWLTTRGKQAVMNFFSQGRANAYGIVGHEDIHSSESRNRSLSQQRAMKVAQVAAQAGARVISVRGMGGAYPVAHSHTHAGKARNRRIEIICYQ